MAGLAVVAPTLVAYNVAPSATFFNQAAAFIGWGLFCIVVALAVPERLWPRSAATRALLGSLTLLVACAVAASLFERAPWSLSLSAIGSIAAAMLVLVVGAAAARAGIGVRVFEAFCIALVVAGIASSVVGLIEVFAPHWPNGWLVAEASIPGRATGNVRQPNHLSSLLLWSMAAAVWLGERWPRWRTAMWATALLCSEVIVLSASRTGLVGMFVLLGWGLLDRRLSRSTRIFLATAPVVYLVLWGASTLGAQAMQLDFEGAKRMSGSGLYVSYSRWRIWENTLSLIAMHPWLGVGFGEFNFAWSLTPFPNRPVAFFDHTHNLLLQFAVELGIPLALAVCGAMGYAVWAALQNAIASGRGDDEAAGAFAPMQRAAFVMVFMVAVHSMLEYPLWYSYFLLPAAFAFGLCLERPDRSPVAAAATAPSPSIAGATRPLVIASMLLVLGGSLALLDYARVVVIFEPPANAGPLEQRIAAGRKSVLFGHHADYAAGTVTKHPGQVIDAFDRATHYLLDTRITMAWANALEERGEDDKARYLAARLREFHNPASEAYFAVCDPANVRLAAANAAASAAAAGEAAPAPAKTPYQCLAPKRGYRFEDFR